jgi:hypothetical protein
MRCTRCGNADLIGPYCPACLAHVDEPELKDAPTVRIRTIVPINMPVSPFDPPPPADTIEFPRPTRRAAAVIGAVALLIGITVASALITLGGATIVAGVMSLAGADPSVHHWVLDFDRRAVGLAGLSNPWLVLVPAALALAIYTAGDRGLRPR